MKKLFVTIILLLTFNFLHSQSVITTTITGSLKVNDSLSVTNNIHSAGNIKATGEIVSKDTMRAEKDVKVDGNASINGNLNVGGTATFGGPVNFNGSLTINSGPAAAANPCLIGLIQAIDNGNGAVTLSPFNPADAAIIDASFETSNPCGTPVPAPPAIIPFVWQTYGNHVNSNNRWIGTIENYDFVVKTNSTQRMVVKNNGQVFIGAKRPLNAPYSNAKLAVDGMFVTREIYVCDQVSAGWADYVFKKDYKLMPLKDVQKFTLQNNHLPNIPDAKNIKEEGQNLGKLQVLQMEKIEEIYLYLFELNKKIDELDKENKELKKTINEK